jgi:hypothetical protein
MITASESKTVCHFVVVVCHSELHRSCIRPKIRHMKNERIISYLFTSVYSFLPFFFSFWCFSFCSHYFDVRPLTCSHRSNIHVRVNICLIRSSSVEYSTRKLLNRIFFEKQIQTRAQELTNDAQVYS